MEIISKQIKDVITEGLPGIEAQLKLSPESRSLFPDKKHKTDAAILILLYKDIEENICTVFMKRQAYNGAHSAQISFPGGKAETNDQSLLHTALRESKEEIGIDPKKVEIIGKLTELYIPVSNFMVHPYIGIAQSIPKFNIDKTEVDYLITFPVHKLISHTISYTNMNYKGKSYRVPYFDIKNEMIWGATAMILSEFIEVLKKVPKLAY